MSESDMTQSTPASAAASAPTVDRWPDADWVAATLADVDDSLRHLLNDTQIRAHVIQLSSVISSISTLRSRLLDI